MNIELLFFASLRERLGLASERLVLPADVQTVGALRQHLAARGGPWTEVFTPPASGKDTLRAAVAQAMATDRKSTRLNSSHTMISYAVFCLKKKKKIFI